MIDIQRNNFTEGRRTRKLYDLPYYKIHFVEERVKIETKEGD